MKTKRIALKNLEHFRRMAERVEKDEKLQPTGCPCCGAGNYAAHWWDEYEKLYAKYLKAQGGAK